MRLPVLLSTIPVLLSPLVAWPASASTATTAKVLSTVCTDGYLDGADVAAARGAGAVTRGFATFDRSAQCGDRITYFTGAGRSWHSETTPLTGHVISVAADATGLTYLLYKRHGVGAPAGTSELALAVRTADGRFGEPFVLAPIDDAQPQDGRGSVVAADGSWYAVWPQYDHATGKYVLYQAETMFGGGAEPGAFAVGDPPGTTTGTHPVLSLAPDGQPQLFWQRDAANGTKDLLLTSGAYGGWGAVHPVATGVRVSPQFGALDIAVTPKATFLSWTRRGAAGDEAVVAAGRPGAWRTSVPPAEDDLGSWDPHIAAGGSTVYAAYGSGDGAPDGAFLGSQTGKAAWSATDATTAIPRSIDTFGVAGLIYLGAGRSTALVYSGHELYAVTR